MNCPSCGTKIDADFGMISCPMCSNVFMVEMDGSIQELKAESENLLEDPLPELGGDLLVDPLAANEYAEADPLTSSYSFEESSGEEPLDTNFAESTVDEDESLSGALSEENSEENSDELSNEESGEYSEEQSEEPSEVENIYSEGFMDEFNDSSGSSTSTSNSGEALDPLGVVAFDESAVSSGTEGLYFYDLKISGLDSAQIRGDVINALTDERFDWVGDEIKKKISGGELILLNLNPVKAVLAVIRLQSLDVDVSWEQKLYTDESLQENEGEA